MAKLKAPVMLTILDGFGIGDVNDPTNAVVQAKPENFFKNYGKPIRIHNYRHRVSL